MCRYYLYTASSLLALCLSACGGGSGTESVQSVPPPPPSAPPPPSTAPDPWVPVTKPVTTDFNTSEYQNSQTAKHSNAIGAWKMGASGAGIKIGFVDTGLNPALAEFSGRVDPASRDVAGSRPMGDEYGHGTALASIAAAAKNDSGIQGIAYNAIILMMRADQPGSCPACQLKHSDIAEGITAASTGGARVINISIGGTGGSSIQSAVTSAAGKGTIFVVAAGNDGALQPSGLAQAIATAAPGQVIIVGALGQGDAPNTTYDVLSPISNMAGSYANSFLSAPGHMVQAVLHTGEMDLLSGTSFAAPVVSGAIALLAEAFPSLTAKQIVELLLTTSDDLGAPGVDDIYGHGRVNIGRAFEPVGSTVLAGSPITVSMIANGTTPAAAGDAVFKGSLPTVILDKFGRAFDVELAKTLKQTGGDRPLARLTLDTSQKASSDLGIFSYALIVSRPFQIKQTRSAPGDYFQGVLQSRLNSASLVARIRPGASIAFQSGGSARSLQDWLSSEVASPFFVTRDVSGDSGFRTRREIAFGTRQQIGSIGITIAREAGNLSTINYAESDVSYRMNSMVLDATSSSSRLRLGFNRLEENDTVLGGKFATLFGRPGSRTSFLDGRLSFASSNGWKLVADLRRGWTKFAAGSFKTAAYSLMLAKSQIWQRQDVIAFRLSQPLVVEKGGLSVSLPVAYDYGNRAVVSDNQVLSLKPSQREIAAEIGYSSVLGRGELGANVFGRLHPGHDSKAEPDVGVAIRLRVPL